MDTSEDSGNRRPGMIPGSGRRAPRNATRLSPSFISWLQAGPMMLVFLVFFLIPLVFVVIVSFWDYNEYQLLPAFSGRGYTDTFEGCIAQLPGLCTIAKTYLKTLKLCFLTWVITLLSASGSPISSPSTSSPRPGRWDCPCSARSRSGPPT